MTTSLHQIDVSHADTLPIACKNIAIPKAVSASFFRDSGTIPQENLSVIGVVTTHSNWDAASTVAADLLTRGSAQYHLYSQQTTPVHVHRMDAVPGNVVMRDATTNGGLTSLSIDSFASLAGVALENQGTAVVGQLPVSGVEPTTPLVSKLPYGLNTSASKWTVSQVQLAAGVPQSRTITGHPLVVVDRYGTGEYVVHAVWAVVSFEGVYVESGLTGASNVMSAIGAQPLTFSSALATVLGIVETVVRVARTIVEALGTRDFALHHNGMSTTVLKSEMDLAKLGIKHEVISNLLVLYGKAKQAKALSPSKGAGKKRSPSQGKAASKKSKPKGKK